MREALKDLNRLTRELAEINMALDEALIVAITDVKGTITFANNTFCRISKYARDELLGQNHRIINSGYHSKEFFKDMWRTIANGHIWRGEVRNRAKDGTFYWMDTTIVPCLNEDGKPYQYVSFRIDITERKKTEEYLRRAERVTAVGELASGIAHEIRNPLAAIRFNLQLLDLERDENKRQIELMTAELERVDSIVGELLHMTKHQEIEYQLVDIKYLLETVNSLMAIHAKRNGVNLTLEFHPDVPQVRCQINQIKQLSINLIKNAIEAMPNGGEAKVAVSLASGGRVLLRFSDEGMGIASEHLQKISEPFFTTKESGTGLGLMITHKIVEDHGGQIFFTSEVGTGTIVDVFLPVNNA